MAKVGAQRAAELTGRSKSTIQRAMNNGKLSYSVDANERRVIDVAELERVFGLQKQGSEETPSAEQELEKAAALMETERLKMRVRFLEEQLESAQTQLEDMKGQRDNWQRQANQVLLTSQYNQKQAEDLREEIKRREQAARERRQKMLGESKTRKPQNENAQDAPARPLTQRAQKMVQDIVSSAEPFNFSGLWKRVKDGVSG
ncbi:MAG: entry exclusion 1 domain-containing protein [Alphaproteobacteria bacterium]|nr:entry exclusion 1 domain-containing protein [Alphaproteobacteria bacterium]